jgi:cytochrome c553
LLLACGEQQARSGQDEPSPVVAHDLTGVLQAHMRGNFGELRVVEHSLVAGNLEDARSHAMSIALSPHETTSAWANEMARVRVAALALANTTDLGLACRMLPRVIVACASCHAAAGVQPRIDHPVVPPDRPTKDARMARHLWATERLSEGLVGWSDESWRSGLAVLASEPLPWSPLIADQELLGAGMQRQAKEALAKTTTNTVPERTTAYGELLLTCVACHGTRQPKS